MGNIFSVRKVIERIGFTCSVSQSYEDIKHASKIILPGVGHFGKAMNNLKERNLLDALNEAVLVRKTPVMGICLGMQLMASHSEEGDVQGLGWFDADVIKFRIQHNDKYKVPHMGWNTISHEKAGTAFMDRINDDDEFYFVHSYHIVPKKEEDILTKTLYEYSFVSSIAKDHIVGYQFHPEKSHKAGEQLIKNFLSN